MDLAPLTYNGKTECNERLLHTSRTATVEEPAMRFAVCFEARVQ